MKTLVSISDPVFAALFALVFCLSSYPASAQSESYKLVADLDAGVGCSFPILIEQRGDPNFYKEFRDRNGKVAGLISAGPNLEYRVTNRINNTQLKIFSKGGMSKTSPNPDGTQTGELNGHSLIILFPTDAPPGPTSTLYEGKLTYAIDAHDNWKLGLLAGHKVDLCKELL